jgi:hypothetical protein
MLVLADGTALKGKLYTIKETALTFDTENGQRRDFELSNVKRMYVSAPGARQLYAAQLNATTSVAGTAGQNLPAGAISVDATRAWTDTGLTVRRGQRIGFSTTGQVTLRSGMSPVSPDGNADEARTGFPVPEAGAGALIARVGNSAAFPIGSSSQMVTMPANGRLYLGINDSNTSDNSGAFIVTIMK